MYASTCVLSLALGPTPDAIACTVTTPGACAVRSKMQPYATPPSERGSVTSRTYVYLYMYVHIYNIYNSLYIGTCVLEI